MSGFELKENSSNGTSMKSEESTVLFFLFLLFITDAGTGIMVLAMAIPYLSYKISIKRSLRFPIDWPSCTLYAFVSWSVLSAFWADHISLVLPYCLQWILLCVIYVLVRNLDFSKDENIFLKLGAVFIIPLNTIIVLGSILLASNLMNELGFEITQNTLLDATRKLSTSPNLLSCLFVILLPCLFYLFNKIQKFKVLVLILIGIYLGLIILFQSKGAIIIILIISLAFIIYKESSERKLIIGLGAGIISLCCVIFVYIMMPDKESFVQNLNPILPYLQVTGDDRLLIWSHTWDLIKANPILGVGAGNWKIAILEYGISDHAYFTRYSHAHNFLLQTFAETGIIGGLLLLELILCPLYYFIYKKDLLVIDSFYILLSIVAFFGLSLFYGIGYQFKFLSIFVFCYAIYFNNGRETFVWLPHFIKIFATIIFCFSAFYFCFISERFNDIRFGPKTIYTRSEIMKEVVELDFLHLHGFKGTKTLAGYIADNHTKLEQYKEALSWYDKGLEMSPFDPYLLKRKGELLFKMGKYRLAIIELTKSRKLHNGDLETHLLILESALFLKDKNQVHKVIMEFNKVLQMKDENYAFYLKHLEDEKIRNYWENRCDQIESYFELLEKFLKANWSTSKY